MKTRQECVRILGGELVSRVEGVLSAKEINKATIDRVLDYLALHQLAFPYFDIDALSMNLCNNLSESINFNGVVASIKSLMFDNAYAYSNGKKVIVNTTALKYLLPAEQFNVLLDSVIRHELDHIATTRNIKVDKETYKKLITRNILAKKNLFGQTINMHGDNFRDYVNKVANKEFEVDVIVDGTKIRTNADKLVLRRSGVRGTQGDLDVKRIMGSVSLNEGITAYKMKKLDRLAGHGGIMCQTAYILGEEIAGHIARTIGEEEFIARQIAGDFVGMAERYKEITGKSIKQMRRVFCVNGGNKSENEALI